MSIFQHFMQKYDEMTQIQPYREKIKSLYILILISYTTLFFFYIKDKKLSYRHKVNNNKGYSKKTRHNFVIKA